MSLINQVLQDLQQRRAPDIDAASATLRDVRIATPRGNRPSAQPWMMWGAIAILASVSGMLLWQRTQLGAPLPDAVAGVPAPSNHVTAMPAQNIPSPPPPAATAAAVPVQAIAAAPVPVAMPTTDAPVNNAAPTTAPAAAAATIDIAPTTPTHRLDKAPPVAAAPTSQPAAVAKTMRPLDPEQQAELAYQDARRLLQSGRPSAAEPRLRAALMAFPEHKPARENLAALLINVGNLSEARALLTTGLEMAPTHAPFAKLYARLLIEANDLVTARTVLERAAPPVQADPEYHALLAALYQRAGLYEQAAQTYRGALQVQPRNGVWWMGLGMALEAGGDTPSALQAYQRARQSGTLEPDVLRYVETKLATLH